MRHKCLLFPALVLVALGSTHVLAAQGSSPIRFVRARVATEVFSHIPQQSKSEISRAAANEQYVLIEIEATEPTEMTFASFVLRGSLKKSYVPSAVAPYSIDRWFHFLKGSDDSWTGIKSLEFSSEEGTKVKYDLFEISLPAKAKVGLCFVTSAAEANLTLSVGSGKPVPIGAASSSHAEVKSSKAAARKIGECPFILSVGKEIGLKPSNEETSLSLQVEAGKLKTAEAGEWILKGINGGLLLIDQKVSGDPLRGGMSIQFRWRDQSFEIWYRDKLIRRLKNTDEYVQAQVTGKKVR